MFWIDWTWPTFWHDLLLVMVWALLLSSIAQSVVHFTTAWVSGHQQSVTTLGPALTRRESSLGVKAVCRLLFELILVVAVTWGVQFNNSPLVAIVACLLIVASVAALWYGVKYLIALRAEYWLVIHTDARQDEREEVQQHRSRWQDIRGRRQDHREDRQDRREVRQDGRETKLDVLDEIASRRQVGQDLRTVRQDERDAAEERTPEPTP